MGFWEEQTYPPLLQEEKSYRYVDWVMWEVEALPSEQSFDKVNDIFCALNGKIDPLWKIYNLYSN